MDQYCCSQPSESVVERVTDWCKFELESVKLVLTVYVRVDLECSENAIVDVKLEDLTFVKKINELQCSFLLVHQLAKKLLLPVDNWCRSCDDIKDFSQRFVQLASRQKVVF